MVVALYHFRLWSNIPVGPEVEGLLAFFGTYGVSVFFVLSGYSLAHAYDADFNSSVAADRLGRYFRHRIGRLAPLFCLAVILSIVGKLATTGYEEGAGYLLANLSLLFGFVNPASTPVIGGWSIGIEVVFYILFPIVMLMRSWAWLFVGIGAFLTIWISADMAAFPTLAKGWLLYVQPANHFVFFAAGIACRVSTSRIDRLSGTKLLALIGVLLSITIVIATETQELDLVLGLRRIFLVFFSVILVWAFAQWAAAGIGESIADLCGGMSYPLYLIHPLAYFGAASILPLNLITAMVVFGCACAAVITVDLFLDRPLQKMVKSNGW